MLNYFFGLISFLTQDTASLIARRKHGNTISFLYYRLVSISTKCGGFLSVIIEPRITYFFTVGILRKADQYQARREAKFEVL
jgi:hypothetical protein